MQHKRKCAANALSAVNPHRTSVSIYNVLDNRKAKPGSNPATGIIPALIFVKDIFNIFLINSNAGIGNRNLYPPRFNRLCAYLDLSTFGSKFYRIANKVSQNLQYPFAVNFYGRQLSANMGYNGDILCLSQWFQLFDDFIQ